MTASAFLKKLSGETVLMGDGAMGTALQQLGLTGCPESYNILQSDVVCGIHQGYLDAGSDIIQTNSFGANSKRLGKHGLPGRVQEFNLAAARLARDVCPKGKFVGGSIGPTGEQIEPYGELSEEEAYVVFLEQAEALADGGVDFLIVETMFWLGEAKIAVRAAKKTGLPVVATMAFKFGGANPRTEWGDSISEIVSQLTECGADVLGANCGCTFAEMVSIAERFRSLTLAPLMIQPDAGSQSWTPTTIEPFVHELLRLKVCVIGGCCGVGPEGIKLISSAVRITKT